jgi:hypothetical protein
MANIERILSMKTTILAALMLAATLQAGAQDKLVPASQFAWPTSYTILKINGVDIPVQWEDGRPKAQHEVLEKLMHVRLEGGATLDCIDAFVLQGYQVRRGHNGEIDARNTNSAANNVVQSHGFATNAGYGQTSYQTRTIPELQSFVEKYTADTGYVRALITIKNTGGSPTPTCMAVGDFVDWYGHKFSGDVMPLKSLQPGESTQLTFFSMVEGSEQQPNGVIKGDKYTCKVRYVSPSGGSAAVRNGDNPFRTNAPTFTGGQVTDPSGRVLSPAWQGGGVISAPSNPNSSNAPGTISNPVVVPSGGGIYR